MEGGPVLLFSGQQFGEGGIFRLAPDGVVAIDRISTSGLYLDEGLLYRIVPCRLPNPSCDLIVYDASGALRSHRLDGPWDVHDVLVRDGEVLVVDSTKNTIFCVGRDNTLGVWWHRDLGPDAWHLNCLLRDGDEVLATAFGKFEGFRGWSLAPLSPSGILMRLPSTEVVLAGLTQPHNPRRLDGAWIVCNSLLREIAAYDDKSKLQRRSRLWGYTRGLAIDERYIYVGESRTKQDGHQAGEPGRITILDRNDWAVIDSFEVPGVPWIYDLVLVPRSLVNGVEIGFRTNPSRAQEEDQLAMFAAAGVQPRRLWATGDPLPAASLRAALEVALPAELHVGQLVNLSCRVRNLGDAIFVSVPPNPIQICYRWYDELGAAVGAGEWVHTPLPRALPPAETLETTFTVVAPRAPGTFTLAVTLLQENVAWFDDLDPGSGVRGAVDVRPAGT